VKKFWLVFVNEYKRHVLRRRFIFAILSMPIFVAFLVLIGFLSVRAQYNQAPTGYIAPAGMLENAQPAPEKEDQFFHSVQFVRYFDEQAAFADMQTGKIQAYFAISDNYVNSGDVIFIKTSKTGSNVEDDFSSFLKYNLLADKPAAVSKRILEGTNLIVRSADGSREMAVDNWMEIMLPILAGVLFIIAVNISGGYLLQAVVEEKENRTMEIIVTSVSPSQLMAGKVLADLLVGLTQLAVWMVFVVLAIKLVPNWLPIGQSVHIDGSMILLIVAIYLPAFVLIAAAMGAVGATATEAREAQQVAGLFTLPIVLPFWFITAIMFNPNGQIATWLSIFPLTAPIAMPLRVVFTTVPVWQTILTIVLLDLLAVFTIWLAGRIFRVGMLQYGKRVSFKQIFSKRTLTAGQK
jgi:ABC-2 type transport system permease protein